MSAKTGLRIWDLLRRFKERCQSKGWKAGDEGNWVKLGENYYVFTWFKEIAPSAFASIVGDGRSSIFEDDFWSVKNAKCAIFISLSGFSKKIIEMVNKTPELSKRVALYDLSHFEKLVNTRSQVLVEFERVIKKEYGAELKPTISHLLR